jgi:hypothetical protein
MFAQLLASRSGKFLVNLLEVATILLGMSILASARSERPWSINVCGSYTPLLGKISTSLDNGWNAKVGGEFNVTRHFSSGHASRGGA